MPASHIYKIMFVNQGKIYEVYARKVSHGNLFGFIEIEELVFGERSTVVLDPTEERIKAEFEGVKRSYLPMLRVGRQLMVELKPALPGSSNIPESIKEMCMAVRAYLLNMS